MVSNPIIAVIGPSAEWECSAAGSMNAVAENAMIFPVLASLLGYWENDPIPSDGKLKINKEARPCVTINKEVRPCVLLSEMKMEQINARLSMHVYT